MRNAELYRLERPRATKNYGSQSTNGAGFRRAWFGFTILWAGARWMAHRIGARYDKHVGDSSILRPRGYSLITVRVSW